MSYANNISPDIAVRIYWNVVSLKVEPHINYGAMCVAALQQVLLDVVAELNKEKDQEVYWTGYTDDKTGEQVIIKSLNKSAESNVEESFVFRFRFTYYTSKDRPIYFACPFNEHEREKITKFIDYWKNNFREILTLQKVFFEIKGVENPDSYGSLPAWSLSASCMVMFEGKLYSFTSPKAEDFTLHIMKQGSQLLYRLVNTFESENVKQSICDNEPGMTDHLLFNSAREVLIRYVLLQMQNIQQINKLDAYLLFKNAEVNKERKLE